MFANLSKTSVFGALEHGALENFVFGACKNSLNFCRYEIENFDSVRGSRMHSIRSIEIINFECHETIENLRFSMQQKLRFCKLRFVRHSNAKLKKMRSIFCASKRSFDSVWGHETYSFVGAKN